MSGGVDSSVAAALLLEEGYAVFGFFAKTWTPQPDDGTQCTWVRERRDALRVAAHLNIPLITVDLEPEYRAGVVDPLVQGYAAGETPNPDVLCNRVVKFAALWRAAQKYGVEGLATGHYAQIVQTNDGPQITRGADVVKDQSYFLWDISREMLGTIHFPIGHLEKPEVRRLADRFGLPVATKKDSQGICFLGPTDIQRFLDGYLGTVSGPIRLTSGEHVGVHSGVHHATIGQRHQIGQVGGKPRSDREPLFVVKIDQSTQTLWVGPRSALYHQVLGLRDPNWLVQSVVDDLQVGKTLRIRAQVRYRQAPGWAKLSLVDDQLIMRFDQPVYAPAPGQSVVVYQDTVLLGGAIIDKVIDARKLPEKTIQ